jgi:3-dehydroquinate dehydratase I
MICISIGGFGFKKCLELVKKYELCELRLDKLKLSDLELSKLIYSGKEIIVSYRKKELDLKGRKLLEHAINNGVSYIDIDINWPLKDKKYLKDLANKKGTLIIASYHNYELTPSLKVLNTVLNKCRSLNPDVIKISCFSKSDKDNLKLLSLLDQPEDMIVVGMGEKGKITRLIAPSFGAFCTYVCVDNNKRTALGQYSIKEMEKFCCSL